MFQDLRADVRFYFQLYTPNQSETNLKLVKIFCVSRGLLVLAVHRLAFEYRKRRPSGLVRLLFKLVVHLGVYLSRLLNKSYILSSTLIEPGVYLTNRGYLTINARKIGSGTLIHDRVTIGQNIMNSGTPEIGRNVWIGSNSVISGGIVISDGVTVLPNTVLTKNLPQDVVVQGNPARVIRRGFDNSELRRILVDDVGNLFNRCLG